MRETKRLKQPPARAGPICCRVVVDRVPNSRCASTSQAATPIPCPTNAAASDTSMHQTHQRTTHMHQTCCIAHMHAADTSVHRTHACIRHVSASDTCIGHRHMHASDTCVRHTRQTHTHASDMLHQTHACIRHRHHTSALTMQGNPECITCARVLCCARTIKSCQR